MRIRKKGTILLAVWSLILSIVLQPIVILAKELSQSGVIDAIHLSKNELNDGEHVKFTVDFSEKQGVEIEEGDTLTLTLPSSNQGYIHGFQKSFDLKDDNNRVLGRVNVQESQVVITFNKEAATLDHVRGHFYFTAEARNIEDNDAGSTVTFETNFGVPNLKKETITITRGPTVGGDYPPYYKVGGMYTNDTDHVKWWLNFNLNRHTMQENAYIEDKVMPGHEMDWDTFKVIVNNQSPALSKAEFENQGYGKIHLIEGNPDHFYIEINKEKTNNASLAFEYQTKITEPDQDSFENQSKVWYDFGENEKGTAEKSNDIVANILVGGGAAGDLKKKEVKISKIDKTTQKPLTGAKLQIYDTTENKEVVSFQSTKEKYTIPLLKGHYYELRELEAPKGYEVAEPITFRVTAYGLVEVKQADGSYKKADELTVVMEDVKKKKTLSLLKVGSDKPNEALAGAQLQLKNLTTNQVVETFETGSSPKKLTVDYGNVYELSELSAPKGYDVAETIVFHVRDDGTIMLKEGNQSYAPLRGNVITMVDHKKAPEKTNVYIKKLAQNEITPVLGAELQIIEADTKKEIQSWTTTASPQKIALENGKSYILKEIKAPSGYLLAKDIAFSISEEGKVLIDGKEVSGATLKMIDLRQEIDLKVLKTSEDQRPLNGVTFLLRNRSTHLIEKEFKTTEDIITLKLKVGQVYDLMEKEPLPGYEAIDPIVIMVKKDGKLLVNGQPFNEDVLKVVNTRLQKEVAIAKKDEETKDLLAGAKLKLTNLTTKETMTWTSSKEVKRLDLKYNCNYRLEEVEAPSGYQLAEPIEFVIRDDGRVQKKENDHYINVTNNMVELFDQRKEKEVSFEKRDALTKGLLAGATLQVRDLTTDKVQKWTSETEAKALTLTYGHRYEFKEIEAPTGYKEAEPLEVEVTLAGEVLVSGKPMSKVTLYNERQEKEVPFKKVDELHQKVEGAVIEMTNTLTGKTQTINTSETTLALQYGVTYQFKEIEVPKGYKEAEPLTIEVTLDGKVFINKKEATSIEMVDERLTKILSIEKRDAQSQLFLPGASFLLTDLTDQKEQQWLSETEGKVLQLIYGHRYELKEIASPVGYSQVQPITIEVTQEGELFIDGQLHESETLVVNNHRLDEPLKFKKVDESGQVLPGAKMVLYNLSDHQSTMSFTTGKTPVELPLKQKQVYRLEEVEAPAGYELAQPLVIMVTELGKVFINNRVYPYDTIEMIDLAKKKQIEIEKRDASTKQLLAGATLQLETEDGKSITSWKSTEKPQQVELITGQTYVLKEVEAPAGYELAQPLTFKLEKEGQLMVQVDGKWQEMENVSLFNERQEKEVPFKKVDELHQKVEGAVIEMTNTLTGKTQTINTSETTLALQYGVTYQFKEIEVPKGYKEAKPLTVEVTLDGKVFVNKKEATSIEMVDERNKKDVVIVKQDHATGKALAGATLVIKDLEDKTPQVEWVSTEEEYHLNLPWGHRYELVEKQAPEHYQRLTKSMPFEVTKDGKVIVDGKEYAELVVENKRKTQEVMIDKVLPGTKIPVLGAKLSVVNENTKDKTTFVTNNQAQTISLQEGISYQLIEESAPVGFAKAQPLHFYINENGELVVNDQKQASHHVVMEDTPLLYVQKRDAQTTQPLKGAKLAIVQQETQETVMTFESTENTVPIKPLQKEVIYQLIEKEAPVGYHLAKPITFKFNNQWQLCILVNGGWQEQKERLIIMDDQPMITPPLPLTPAKPMESMTSLGGQERILLNNGVPKVAYQVAYQGKLPQTGTERNRGIMIVGIMLVTLSIAGIIYYRRRVF